MTLALLGSMLLHGRIDALLAATADRLGVRVEYRSLRVTLRNGILLHEATFDNGEYRLETERTRIGGSAIGLFRGALPLDTVELTGAQVTALERGETVGAADHLTLRLRTPTGALRSFDPARVQLIGITAGHVALDLRGPASRTVDATNGGVNDGNGVGAIDRSGMTGRLATSRGLLGGAAPFIGPIHTLPDLLELLPRHIHLSSAALRLANGAELEFLLDFEHRPAAEQFRIRTAGRVLTEHADAGTWSVDQQVRYRSGEASGVVRIDDLDLAVLGRLVGGSWRDRLAGGRLDLLLDARSGHGTEGSAIEKRPATSVDAELRLSSGLLNLPAVAAESIALPGINYRFRAQVDVAAPVPAPRLYRPLPVAAHPVTLGSGPRGAVVFERGDLRFGRVELEVRPTVRGLRGLEGLPERVELLLQLPPTQIRDIAESLPAALLGPLAAIDADGTIGWTLDFESPTHSIARMQWRSEVTTDELQLRHIPAELDVYQLRGAFIHRIVDSAHGVDRVIRVPQTRPVTSRWLAENAGLTAEEISRLRERIPGMSAAGTNGQSARPAVPYAGGGARSATQPHRFSAEGIPDPAYRYVPLASISPWLVRAILVAEDGDFFHHHGVNWNAVRRAVERNVESGEVVVGASTISMQLAKNLFLSNERMLSRKLQEYILVLLMERAAAIPKERLLEIYLNIIEFGPGVYGIHDAARYYFARHPRELTAAEAVWLASIVPSPRRLHRHFEAGEVPEYWFARMVHLMRVMHVRGRMTEEQFLVASATRPRFATAPHRAAGGGGRSVDPATSWTGWR